MRTRTIVMAPTTLDRDGFVASQTLTTTSQYDFPLEGLLASGYDGDGLVTATTPTAAGSMAMDGLLYTSSTLTVFTSERFLEIYSDGNESGVTFQITGTNKEGHVISEVMTGPNAIRASSTLKYLTVTDISISGAGTGNITVGSMGIGTMTTPGAIGLYAFGTESDITFTVVGVDRYGNDNSETITGPAAGTVTGAVDWTIIQKVTASATVDSAVEVGSVGTVFSQWVPVDKYGGDVSIGCTLSSGAGMTYAVQHTFDDIQAAGFQEDDANVFVHATITGETTSQDGSYSTPITACRVAITAFTAGTLTFQVVQSGS